MPSVTIERKKPRPAVQPIERVVIRCCDGRTIVATFRVVDGCAYFGNDNGYWTVLMPGDLDALIHALSELYTQTTGATICLP